MTLYNCNLCKNDLGGDSFSKSQINKLEHQKIETVRCIACTAQVVEAKDGPQKVKSTNKPVVLQPEVKVFDPSAQFIRNPSSTPIMVDAVAFAKAHSLEYPIKLGPIRGWRTVVKLAARGVIKYNKRGKESISTTIGLFKPGSHIVVPCLSSAAHHPLINQTLTKIEEVRQCIGLHGYVEGSGFSESDSQSNPNSCYLKYVILVVARESQKVQLSLVWNSLPPAEKGSNSNGEDEKSSVMLQSFISGLLACDAAHVAGSSSSSAPGSPEHPLLHSIWVNYNPSSRYCNAITGREPDSWRLLYGKQYCQEIVSTDMKRPPRLMFPPFVFRQANICAFTNIIQNIRNWVRTTIPSAKNDTLAVLSKKRKVVSEAQQDIRCVELYAGVGTIGLNCLDLLSDLRCSDANPHNLACFEAARQAMEPASIRGRACYEPKDAVAVVLRGLAGRRGPEPQGHEQGQGQGHGGDDQAPPASTEGTERPATGLRDCDLVIVDPPRKGLDDEVVHALLQFYPASASASAAHTNAYADGGDGAAERNARRLIYVSCGFPAFKRDAARLLGLAPAPPPPPPPTAAPVSFSHPAVSSFAAPHKQPRLNNSSPATAVGATAASATPSSTRLWRLVHLEGHVLFPGSDHIETLAVFDRDVD
jgi:hypothetical protein